MKCFERISEYECSDIFIEFRSINDKNQQDTFLQALIEKTDVKRNRTKRLVDANIKPRAWNFRYALLIPEGNKIRVCNKAFCSIFGVSRNRVRRLASLLLSGKTPVDKRGSAPCSFAIKEKSVFQVFPSKKYHITALKKFVTYQLNLM